MKVLHKNFQIHHSDASACERNGLHVHVYIVFILKAYDTSNLFIWITVKVLAVNHYIIG